MLSLGGTADREAAGRIAEALRGIDDVQSARSLQTRAIDPGTAMFILEVVGSALAAVGSAWELITKIREAVGPKKFEGARITLPNGTRIELDSITRDELKELIESGGTGN
jgi:hypothetical protein